MKNIIIILLATVCLTSCNKNDENGYLDGNWQLVSWEDNTSHTIIATNNTTKIYYTIKLDILQIRNINDSYDTFFLSYFHYTTDSLFVGKTFLRPYDKEVKLDSLGKYGCTTDGKFAIKTLTKNQLVLLNTKYLLTFRKY